jgi:glucose-1-phosphate thymidylyltransferase
VQRPGLWRQAAAAAVGGEPQGQIEVLVVEEDPLVKAADGLEPFAAVEGGTAGWSEGRGSGLSSFSGLAVQVVEPHQGRVGDDTGGVDQLRRSFLQQHSGDRGDALAQSVQQRLDEPQLGHGVVVEQDHRVARSLRHRSVDRPPEAEVLAQLHHLHARQLAPRQLNRVVGRAVVDEDDGAVTRLFGQGAEDAAQAGGAVEVGDVNGWSHRSLCRSIGFQPRMEPLKGLILSGGAGTRLRPITHTSAKQLVPVANKPVLFYGIEALVDAGVKEIGIIIAPETGDEIREAAGDGSQFGAEITYIVQDKPAGLAHAVLTAEEFIGGSPFVMYLGDNLLRDGIRGLVSAFTEHEPDALILLTPVDDPQSYGVAELDGERIVRLIEKPKDPPSNLALVGVYLFSNLIFDSARSLEPSWRGELEITEAIDKLIDEGRNVRSEVVRGWWKDTGQLADMLEANRLVLEELVTEIEGDVDEASKVEGRVVIGPGAKLEGAVVRGPAVIGPGAHIEDAYIGPYTSIGEDVHVRRSEVENSIVLSGSVVEDLGTRMEASLLGKEVKLTRSEGMPKTLRLLVGDKSEIKLV